MDIKLIKIIDLLIFYLSIKKYVTKFAYFWFGLVAQLVEQRTENPCVGGSIPPEAT
tara:strand:+ start:114 stop:281 length:168 start_codon:yes stop_codon:yes gene_type:complete